MKSLTTLTAGIIASGAIGGFVGLGAAIIVAIILADK